MHKIGLVSVHNPNYGSMLQTYALHTYLNGIGADNEIILYTKKNDLRQMRRLMNIQLVLMKGRVVYRDIYCWLFHPDIAKQLSLRMSKFDDFKNKYFKFSRNHIGWKDLLTTNQDYDTFIIGSDQVWNPINIGIDEHEQNGVTVPSGAAAVLALIPWNLPRILLVFSGGKKLCINEMIHIRTQRRIIILMVS